MANSAVPAGHPNRWKTFVESLTHKSIGHDVILPMEIPGCPVPKKKSLQKDTLVMNMAWVEVDAI